MIKKITKKGMPQTFFMSNLSGKTNDQFEKSILTAITYSHSPVYKRES
jgi:hypothetical protein